MSSPSTKKYYLNVDHRRTIVDALYEAKIDIKKDIKDGSGRVFEMAEEKNQDLDMLIKLFELSESEQI